MPEVIISRMFMDSRKRGKFLLVSPAFVVLQVEHVYAEERASIGPCIIQYIHVKITK